MTLITILHCPIIKEEYQDPKHTLTSFVSKFSARLRPEPSGLWRAIRKKVRR